MRSRNRIRDAQLPRMKTLEEFDFAQAPQIPAAQDSRTGRRRLHRAQRTGGADRRMRNGQDPSGDRTVRGGVPAETAGALHHGGGAGQRAGGSQAEQPGAPRDGAVADVRTDRARRGRLCAAGRHRRGVPVPGDLRAGRTAALIVTTNLPFSEWTHVFPNPRLCKALLDRITDRAHIIETGTESFRFRRTMEGRKKKKAS